MTISKLKIAIIVSKFNDKITSLLKEGAIAEFKKAGLSDNQILITTVPGAFEIPLMAQKIFDTQKVDGILTLGVVIRGETAHFDYVAGECARGVMDVMLQSGKPISFGVLTTETRAQAEARSGGDHSHKGHETAQALLDMVSQIKKLNA